MNTPWLNAFDDPGTCRYLIDLQLAETPEDVETAWAWLMNKYNDAALVMRLIEVWCEDKGMVQ